MIVNVKVKPGSSQEKIEVGADGILTIWTHSRAHDGEANKAIIEALADYYQLPKTSIKLIRGATSKVKTFEI